MTSATRQTELVASRPFCVEISGTTIIEDAAPYRQAFGTTPALLFEDVFSAPLLDRLMARAGTSGFTLRDNGHVGLREFADDGSIGAAFALMLDRPLLCSWLTKATGCPPMRGVVGSINQATPGTDNGLTWHDDLTNKGRMLGIVVNLSDSPYDGGIFEMRPKGSVEPLLTCHHVRRGSTLIFAVRPDLEHRVTPLTSGGPRRVYTGWFLRDEASQSSAG